MPTHAPNLHSVVTSSEVSAGLLSQMKSLRVWETFLVFLILFFHCFMRYKKLPTERNTDYDYPCKPVSGEQRPVWWAYNLEAVFWEGTFLCKWLSEGVRSLKETFASNQIQPPIKQVKSVRPADISITEALRSHPHVYFWTRELSTLILSYVSF